MSDPLHFKTNVLLKDVLGRELINDDNIAILELVKNGYDAASTISVVKFAIDKETNLDEIHIIDHGIGMDLNAIKTKWLNIAYSEKKINNELNGKVFAGAKGVGRFSCDRLGKRLFLYTKKENAKTIKLTIDWEEFENDKKGTAEIQSVDIFHEIVDDSKLFKETGIKNFKHGTIVRIADLRAEWKRDKILSLRRHLEKMINPNLKYVKNSFNIDVIAEEYIEEEEKKDFKEENKTNGKIKNAIFEKLEFRTTRIVSEIDDTGDLITTVLYDRGREVFRLVEFNRLYNGIKNVKIDIHYLNPYAKVYFKKQSGFRVVDFGSVFLFVNGFRIPPYGEAGNDWLQLDKRKQQGTMRFLGTREVVGRIEVRDRHGDFKVISSREGIVKNDKYSLIFTDDTSRSETFFYKTFKRLEKYVVEGLEWDKAIDPSNPNSTSVRSYINELEKKSEQLSFKELQKLEYWATPEKVKSSNIKKYLFSILDVEPEDVAKLEVENEIIQSLREEDIETQKKILGDFEKYDPKLLSRSTKSAIESIKEILKKTEKRLEEERIRREALESKKAGSDKRLKELEKEVSDKKKEVATLKEEVKKKSEQVYFHKRLAGKDLGHTVSLHHNIGIHTHTISTILSNFQRKLKGKNTIPVEDVQSFIKKIAFENNTISSITNFATSANFSSESTERSVDIPLFVSQYLEMLDTNNIYRTINHEKLKITILKKSEATLFQKLVPIELVMLIDNLISNSIKANSKEFRFEFNEDEKNFYLVFSDDGNGIKKENLDKVFESGFTTTYGAGLGLSHVEDTVKKMNGSVEVTNGEFNGVVFTVEIKK